MDNHNHGPDQEGQIQVHRQSDAFTAAFGNNENHVALSISTKTPNFVQIIVRTDHGLSGIRIPEAAFNDLLAKFKEEQLKGNTNENQKDLQTQ